MAGFKRFSSTEFAESTVIERHNAAFSMDCCVLISFPEGLIRALTNPAGERRSPWMIDLDYQNDSEDGEIRTPLKNVVG